MLGEQSTPDINTLQFIIYRKLSGWAGPTENAAKSLHYLPLSKEPTST
jgi:hypothetical protein